MENIDIESLKKEMKQTKDSRYKTRLQAIILKAKGYSYKEITKILSIHYNTYYDWIKRFKESGTKGLKEIKSGNKNGVLKYKEEIFEALFREIDKMDRHWTVLQMSEWINEEFGINIKPNTVQYRLHRANYSWKTNRPSPYKGDKEKQDTFKKTSIKRWVK